MEYYGHVGNVLYVDLSTGHIKKQPLDINLAQKFIGGVGVGLRLLLDILEPNIDPLSPKNVLIFGTGPLIGTLCPGAGKCYLTTKYAMPASRDRNKYFVSTSESGSTRLGTMMKNAGYDHIVITGRAEKPSYLKVTDEDVEICDASDIWGKDVYEAGRILRERYRGRTGNCGTFVIGRAGENLVRFAIGFVDDWYSLGRFAGAVVGAKNLKAVVTLGGEGIKLANKKRFMELVKKKRQEIRSHIVPASTREFKMSRVGRLATETTVSMRGCSGGGCSCKSIYQVPEGKYKGAWFGAVFSYAPVLFHQQLQLEGDPFENYCGGAFKLLGMMNTNGLCIITTLWMMKLISRLYESGILSKEDMGGLEFRKGNLDYYCALIEKIINRQDIGAIMAEGWYPLCERLGIDASHEYETGTPISKGVDYVIDARTWDWPPFSSRRGTGSSRRGTGFGPAMGLASVVHAKTKHNHEATLWTNRELSVADVKRDAERMGLTKEELGRIFTENSFDTGRLEKYAGEAETVCNALGICSTAFNWLYDPIRDMPWLSEAYSAATGFEITPHELLRAGERIFNLEKLLNVREGFTREDDRIPSVYLRNTKTPLQVGEMDWFGRRLTKDRYLTDWFGKRLTKEDLEGMLDSYYEERGWDIKKGVPTIKRLIELGLGEFAGIVESV